MSQIVDDFVGAAAELTPSELLALVAVYKEADADKRSMARLASREAASQLGAADDLDRAQGAVAQWAASAAQRVGSYAFAGPMVDPLLVDLRAQAIPAFVDAVSAILAGDALDAEASEVLLGPWRRVTDNSI